MDRKIPATAVIVLFVFQMVLPAVSAQNNEYDLILVRNDDLIDYIVALPYSKHLDVPILPVNPQELDPATLAQLQSYEQFGWYHVLVIGDYQAISQKVQEQLMSLGFQVTRIGGATRVDTAANLAKEFYSPKVDAVVLASASDYGSALAAARWAMAYNHPLLLTSPSNLSASVKSTLEYLQPHIIILIGAGMSKNIEDELNSLGYTTHWVKENLTISVPTSTTPQGTNWSYVIGAVIITLAIAIPTSLYYAKKKWAANRVPIEVLTEKERAVVKAILEKGGTIKQEELPELTGYSRPTISRIIQELEKKQLVEREKTGKTFIVKLTKEIIMRE
ncbi:cell wall-binding repeat-containing protein [Thermococcus stetteri]|uniref:cell wall-binding repeat-containing protein n=1 Tax=Thermococcus stetteri TaxID=49900 RepID=UPI001AE61950|nr:cell wall-binding repeat-containing protein [Thermococcus stetteri]MBP1911140.1 putative membrane protein [Thermococcus stetteri]